MSAEWDLVFNIINAWVTHPFSQTTVAAIAGATAGALIAFHRQNSREERKELEKNIGLINFSLISLAANIEKAINLKKTFLPRSKDATAIKSIPKMQEFLNSGKWEIDVGIYNSLPENLKKYLICRNINGEVIPMPDLSKTGLAQTVNDFSFLPLPDLQEMAGLAKKHPHFLTLAQKINDGCKEAIYTNKRINESIINFTMDGRKVDEIKFSLLLSYAELMEKVLDSILPDLDKCKEILCEICNETLPDKMSGIHRITIKEEFLKYFPKKDPPQKK